MKKKTVNDVIIEILTKESGSLQPKDILKKIAERKLYEFKSANPENIIRNQLRRHSTNVMLPAASSKQKYYTVQDDGSYGLVKK